jgi:hypothetical protein
MAQRDLRRLGFDAITVNVATGKCRQCRDRRRSVLAVRRSRRSVLVTGVPLAGATAVTVTANVSPAGPRQDDVVHRAGRLWRQRLGGSVSVPVRAARLALSPEVWSI